MSPRSCLRLWPLVLAVAAGAPLLSCAPKKSTPAETPAAAKPSPSPRPAAASTATPSPTPEARYTATVRVDGGPSATVTSTPRPSASPSPTPSASPTASPSPTPKKSTNPLAALWAKIRPGKKDPATAAAAAPKPTPAVAPGAPREGFFTRLWHRFFPPKETPPAAAPPQWIGTIRLVNAADGYVLVDTTSGVAVAAGQELRSVGNDTESGVVRVSPDRNPPFFLADIVSGRPRVGDRIYSPQP